MSAFFSRRSKIYRSRVGRARRKKHVLDSVQRAPVFGTGPGARRRDSLGRSRRIIIAPEFLRTPGMRLPQPIALLKLAVCFGEHMKGDLRYRLQ